MKIQLLATIVVATALSSSVFADSHAPGVEEIPAGATDGPIVIYRKVYLNESLPDLGARLYDKVNYELKLRKLDHDISIAQAELENRRERARIYNKYFGRTSALLLTRQNAQLDVLKSQEQLKSLRKEKLLALRHRADQVRYRKLLLAENAVQIRVAE